jgi:hypothetical protein
LIPRDCAHSTKALIWNLLRQIKRNEAALPHVPPH